MDPDAYYPDDLGPEEVELPRLAASLAEPEPWADSTDPEISDSDSPAPLSFVVVSVYVRPGGGRVVHAWGPPGSQREATNRRARMRRADAAEYAGDPRAELLSLHVCRLMNGDR